MGDKANLTTLTNQLRSDKVKERQEALVQLRSTFANDRAVSKLAADGKSKNWLVLFDALFDAFGKEKALCHKKGLLRTTPTTGPGATILRRLGEVASTVRWLVERAVPVMTAKIMQPVLNHLYRNIRYDGKLLGQVSLDYVKAIKCIITWRPHLDHLEGERWIDLVELSFNVVLDDSFSTRLEDPSAPTSTPALDETEEVAHSDGYQEHDDSDTSQPARKRRRLESGRTLTPSTPSRLQKSLPVTLEKIEFTSLLATLLRSSSSPIIYKMSSKSKSEEAPLVIDCPYLPGAVLDRLRRFLIQYPADTSLHHDYLLALSGVLSQVALNERQLTIDFARATWPALVGMWGTKNQRLKEDLVIVLRILFPFLLCRQESTEYDEGPLKLWKALEGEAHSRWGVDNLSLDSLRLEVLANDTDTPPRVFAAKTFQHGWHFDPSQALAWTVLELQADCVEKVYRMSESPRSVDGSSKDKMVNPIVSILSSIVSEGSTHIRTSQFQTLLFFADRHWSVLHSALRHQVVRVLTQCLSFDDPVTQSWSFMCLAAIAHAEGNASSMLPPSSSNPDLSDYNWDTVWTLAMRRSNVPAVCRAACLAAGVLLHHAKELLTPGRMQAEIENLAKDLDMQGPSLPYDSVCAFLVLCMRVASQDVTLYRMHLEDKVLAWLVDNWRLSGVTRKMPSYTVQDILTLLGSACSMAQQGDFLCSIQLPDCSVVAAAKEDHSLAVIRDFLLHATLPAFHKATNSHGDSNLSSSRVVPFADNRDLMQPRGRERRVTAFFLKVLDEANHSWETQKEVQSLPTVERVRTTLDLCILALSFESLLLVNGFQPNRRVMQAACKVIVHLLPTVQDERWDLNERALLVHAFSPLYLAEVQSDDHEPWDTLLPLGSLSGIRTEVLRSLTHATGSTQARARATRRRLQRAIFHSSDVQDAFAVVLQTLRKVLETTVDQIPEQDAASKGDEIHDSFAGVRISKEASSSTLARNTASSSQALHHIIDVCISSLAVFPILYSSTAEPTRDTQLIDWILAVGHEAFLAALPSLLKQVQQRNLNLSLSRVGSLLDLCGNVFLAAYPYSRNEEVQRLLIQLLRSTMYVWLDTSANGSEVGRNAQDLCVWLLGVFNSRKLPSWRNRDLLVQFLDEYVSQDPNEVAWLSRSQESDDDDDGDDAAGPPRVVLPRLGADDDIRVRFRAASANAKLFHVAHTLKLEPIQFYLAIRETLSARVDHFEEIVTRMLCLGNVMIVSSAVRRGPYWHLLETCFHSGLYEAHIRTILDGVATRLGMLSCATLFDIYASQIAYSIRQNNHDLMRLPPQLLGYPDKRVCAEKAFKAFAPANIVAGGSDPEAVRHGRKLFTYHCLFIQKTIEEGLLDCLPEIVGTQLVFWVGLHETVPVDQLPQLDDLLRPKLTELYESGSMDQYLRQQADGIVTAVVRTLSDQDFSSDGPIAIALELRSSPAAKVFQQLVQFRTPIMEVHEVILPAYSASIVLKALDWFDNRIPHAEDSAISYHVLHRLFEALDQAALVNEQLRILNALCLWVACHHTHFDDATVLYTLLNGAANIINQVDLARYAQSLLHWGFTSHIKLLPRNARLNEIILRSACAAHAFSQNTSTDTATTGASMLQWAEEIVATFLKSRSLRSLAQKVLMAWPREYPPHLQDMIGDLTPCDLSNVLADERISSNKFRLVRHLKRLADTDQYHDESFSKRDFWLLKECIPPVERLRGDEVDSFISLLTHQGGRIDGLEVEIPQPQTACTTYVSQHFKDAQTGRSDQGLSARKAIVTSLLAQLDGADANQVHLAYKTLRSLAAITGLDQTGSNGWPAEYQSELEVLRAYAQPLKPRPHPDLDQLLSQGFSPATPQDYQVWVTNLAASLSDVLAASDPFYTSLSPLLEVDHRFAEQCLPILIHIYLHFARLQEPRPDVETRNTISQYFTMLLQSAVTPLPCRKVLVDTVLHLREWMPPSPQDWLAYDRWLDLDYVLLSQNAVKCGAYTTALLFLELGSEHTKEKINSLAREQILYQIYGHIDEPDGFYAISTQDVQGLLLKHLHHEQQWNKAFQFHGAMMETRDTDPSCVNGVLHSLRAFGFDSLAMTTLQSVPGAEAVVDPSMSYQLGWRAEAWDLPAGRGEDTSASLYFALRAIHREREAELAASIVSEQLLRQMTRLRALGRENLVEIRQVSQVLMCLNEVRQWQQEEKRSPSRTKEIPYEFALMDSAAEFADLEAILATRISLLRSVRQQEQREQVGMIRSPLLQKLIDRESDCLLQLSRAARASQHTQIAINSIVRAQKLNQGPHFEVECEFANVLWHTKEPKIATESLRSLLSASSEPHAGSDPLRRAQLLALMGTWASQACLEKPTDIKSHYFDAAVSSLQAPQTQASSSVYHDYAIFAERQYHTIVKSPDLLRLKVYINRKTAEIKRRAAAPRVVTQAKDNRQLQAEKVKAETVLNIDKALHDEYIKSRNVFLKQAIKMWSLCLAHSNAFDDDAAIRLCSLWFANFENIEEHIPTEIGTALARIPSHKFVFLAHQLSARLSETEKVTDSSENQDNLRALIMRMCKEHPFHCLFPVYCLRSDSSSSKSPHTGPEGSQALRRASAAGSVLSQLQADPSCTRRICDIVVVCDASVQWAKYPIRAASKLPQKNVLVPTHLQIHKLSKINVPVITAHTPLDPTCRYDDCVTIDHYEKTYDTAGGASVPKIIRCVGSDGRRYKQLFKGEGNDDLRQDAVMEQVFDLVNIILRNDRDTMRRNLRVRGYKVVPLAAQAGVLEFVGNTQSLHSWLISAHVKYNSDARKDAKEKDITPAYFQHTMYEKRKKHGNDVDPAIMTALFTKLRQRFRPVMRHYFTEHTKDPVTWFKMRLYYARSLATTSIVGHVLGLGDRHLSNILLDDGNGEVVHIDLGIAFEQGQLLPVPERVPFRLTADMVDGLGTTKTQGVFQRCAEETLRVLRDRSDVILTVLEVFKHDPLHSWTASATRLQVAQPRSDDSDNKPKKADGDTNTAVTHLIGFNVSSADEVDEAADRALSAVTRKLDKNLSVEFTVNELIAEATDVVNLANMYSGWAPHC